MTEQVFTAVDNQIEFKGFKGRYFYWLSGGILGSILLVFILYILKIQSVYTFGAGIFTATFSLVVSKYFQSKYGRWGHIHNAHKNNKNIIVNHSFKSIIN